MTLLSIRQRFFRKETDMGGQNHQPCNKYLTNSTRLSRALSAGRICLEQANLALEDLILAELDGNIGSIDPVISSLTDSDEALAEMQEHASALREQMRQEGYTDLPPLADLDLPAFALCLETNGMSDETTTANISTMLQSGGFWSVLEYFDVRIVELRQQTQELRSQVKQAHEEAAAGVLQEVLEENGPANFKCAFASLYTTWASFQQHFLASSLISTEVWYRHIDAGSLIETTISTSTTEEVRETVVA